MKTQITKFMAAAMLLTAPFATQANTKETERSLKISKQSNKAIVLQLGDLAQGTEISLVDQNGKVLFEENTTEDKYSKTFDLNAMQEGDLYLEIESDDKLEIVPIEVTASAAVIKRSAEMVIEKAIVKMNGDQAKVFFGDNEAATKLTLFDQHGDIAYRESVSENTGSKTYDLSKLAEGNYQLQVSTKGRTFYHTIILN